MSLLAGPIVGIPKLRLGFSSTCRDDVGHLTLPIEATKEEGPARPRCLLSQVWVAAREVPRHCKSHMLDLGICDGRPDGCRRPGDDAFDPWCVRPRPTQSECHVAAQTPANWINLAVGHSRGAIERVH